ncbi:MAG TPA: LPS export ABC transporter permease LptF [Gammaproteobacteria bacterium]|nr:LPS export ABC transporter permease LptF [Gammaproteobacteria bacterium]
MLRIFDRYLLKEVIYGWLAVTVILWLILVSNRLVRYLADAAEGDIPGELVFKLLGLKMAWYMIHIVPFALALGVVLGLGRLYRDSEMTVMAACGVGTWRIYKPVMGFGLLVAAALVWLALYVSPEVQDISHRLEKAAGRQADVMALGAGRFNEIQNGRLTFYAERLSADKQTMENLFISVRNLYDSSKPRQIVRAKSAYRKQDEATGDHFLVLVDGLRYEGSPGDAAYRVMKFDEYGVRIDLPRGDDITTKREATPTATLMASSNPDDIAEVQWRLSMPLSVISLLMLAVPLCKSSPRQGRYGRLVLAILLFVIYYNLLGTAKVWVGDGNVPPVIGLWWVPALPVLVSAMLLGGEGLFCRMGLRR